jgi:transposase InsO family protein
VGLRRIRAMGIRDKPIAPAAPWQNAFAERLIGSIRRECLDHIVVLGEAHLRRILSSESVTSRHSLFLGGLHHHYVRVRFSAHTAVSF